MAGGRRRLAGARHLPRGSGRSRRETPSGEQRCRAPEGEPALAEFVEAATAAGQYDAADEAAGKRIRLNPNAVDPVISRAVVNLSRGHWEKVEADCRTALRLHPLHPQAHLYLGICLHKQGDPAAGQRELQTAVRLETDEREQAILRDWYRQSTR